MQVENRAREIAVKGRFINFGRRAARVELHRALTYPAPPCLEVVGIAATLRRSV